MQTNGTYISNELFEGSMKNSIKMETYVGVGMVRRGGGLREDHITSFFSSYLPLAIPSLRSYE